MDVGKGIKELRKEKGITQIELAEKIDVSSQYISDVERGRNTPTDKTMKRILEPFDISHIDFLIDYCGVKKEKEPESPFELLNEENQKQVSDYIEFLLARQSFK